jgi:tetratricopeptide (TPR) repeat protein
VSPELEAEVGWHLYRGGERERGAALLERAGVRLYEAQSFRDAIPALEATLEVREAERAPVHRVLAIRHRLVMAGFFADRKVALRHAEESIAMLRRSCGMDTAAWLSRALPPLAALGAGMALATGRHWALGGGPAPRAALPTLYVEVAYLAVLRSFSFHIQEVRAHKVLLEPLRALRGRVPEAAYLTVTLTVAMPLGRFAEARVAAERSLEILRSDRRSAIPDADRATAMGAALMCLAFIGALEHDPHCLRLLVEVEALGLRYFDVSAEVVRTSYHRSRGEEELAVECEARVEQLLVQSGALWGPESQLVWMGALSYGGTRDLAGLRRSIGELSRLEADGFRVGGLLALTRGEYLRERGELVLARASLDEALAFVAPDDALVRVPALNGLAELALAERDPDRATSLAREALAIAESPAVRSLQGEARARRALALAHAARGDAPRARAVLDDTLARVAHLGSPSTSGALYEARARVAFDDGDAAACELDRQKADGLFRATRSSALVARAEALPHPVLAISRSPRRAHDAAADATMVEAAAAQGVADPTDGPGGLPAGAPTGGPGQRRSLRTGGD